jgi:hypothetical protein
MDAESRSWQSVALTVVVIFLIAGVGCTAAFALWLRDISEPQIAFLGSGNRLSLLVMDGPARLVIASGDDPIGYENALTSVQPLFARRVDLLLTAGQGQSLLVPLAAHDDSHARSTYTLAVAPGSPEADALGQQPGLELPRRIRLGPSLSVTVETALPFGADPVASMASWRATIDRGASRVVVYSDGDAVALFPPLPRAAVLAVAGDDPAVAMEAASAVAFIACAAAIDGPDLRAALAELPRPPSWSFRVASGEALRLRLTANGVELPSEPAQNVSSTPEIALSQLATVQTHPRVRRRA